MAGARVARNLPDHGPPAPLSSHPSGDPRGGARRLTTSRNSASAVPTITFGLVVSSAIDEPVRVVVAGFGPFGSRIHNPAEAIAAELAARGARGAQIQHRALAVNTADVDRFITDMLDDPPEVILGLGVGRRAQIEERPENYVDDHSARGARPIRPGGPQILPTHLPVSAIASVLSARYGEHCALGSSVSDPAYQPSRTAFLCNYLAYRLADAFGKSRTTAGFLHVTSKTPVEQIGTVLDTLVARQRALPEDVNVVDPKVLVDLERELAAGSSDARRRTGSSAAGRASPPNPAGSILRPRPRNGL
jgi:pyrrolidone-carboxylate peptidase